VIPGTITIGRATRHVLRQELMYQLTGAGEVIEYADLPGRRQEVAEALGRASWAFGKLDELGFEEDDKRNSFVLSADDSLVTWLRARREMMAQELRSDREQHAKLLAGDGRQRYISQSVEESIQYGSRHVSQQAAELSLVDQLIVDLCKAVV
jgi:hypothetical protein